ncbi:monocarboxylate transporter 1 isoform X1 [Ixodes scapularis]|uniref:monocarboxylate transporter 1 isoform X1 n=2 Tax=Ixodes scapularis TaxID=6945 RepID=UPI001A9F7443|nr:monocarboxylate transporter 1 isoform X1 [Ixodes scapularis]
MRTLWRWHKKFMKMMKKASAHKKWRMPPSLDSSPVNIPAEACHVPTTLAAGVLARYISVWKLTLAGSVVSAMSVSLCYFANGIPYLIAFYGILQGITAAYTTLTTTVINRHFTNYKTVASGISNAGFTIGGLAFPPIAQLFFDRYGLRGGLLLGGALMLNAAAAALLQRDPRVVSVPTSHEKARTDSPRAKALQGATLENEGSRAPGELSAGLLPKSARSSSEDNLSTEDEDINILLSSRVTDNPGTDQLNAQNIELVEPQVQDALNMYDVSRTAQKLVTGSSVQSHILGSLSFFAIPKFYAIAFSYSHIFLSVTTYITVVVDFAMDQKILKWNAVLLITIFATAEMVSSFASGWVTDKGFLRRSTMMTLHFLLSAMALFLLPLCYSYSLMVLMSVILGWSTGATEILIHVFFMELVESANFSVCFGAASLMAGLSGLARPPIIGHFRDGLGSYRGLFWLLGTLSACNVVLWCGLCLRERRRCNERNLDKRQPKEHPQA